jgi:hypothetical protein
VGVVHGDLSHESTIAAVALLALAIGIATAMFTTVDAPILRPVPFDNPNELAHIHMGDEQGGPGEASPHFNSVWTELQELRAGPAAFVKILHAFRLKRGAYPPPHHVF